MKSTIEIKVTSNGQTIGHLTAAQFMNSFGTKTVFLGTLIERFNNEKTQAGEPERAEIVLRK